MEIKSEDKWFVNYFLPATTIVAMIIAAYIIKHPEFVHPERYKSKIEIMATTPIQDTNGDGILELRVQYSDGSTADLLSHIDNGAIVYRLEP